MQLAVLPTLPAPPPFYADGLPPVLATPFFLQRACLQKPWPQIARVPFHRARRPCLQHRVLQQPLRHCPQPPDLLHYQEQDGVFKYFVFLLVV